MSETTRKKKIPKSLAGTRLDKVLPALWPDLSRRQGRRAIAEGRVRVGGVALKVASRAVRAVGFVEIEEAGTDLPEPPDLQVPVLFEDKDVVVLDKPPGVAVQPGRSADLPDLLRWWSHGHEGEILKVVHRLDVPASGLVVLARTRASAAALSEAFRERTICRRYRLRCSAAMPFEDSDSLVVDRPLLRDRGRAEVSDEGKAARTTFRRHEGDSEGRELTAELDTGRFHQVRAHAAWLGAPVVGDRRYGGEPAERLHLHACTLAFELFGSRHELESPAPWELPAHSRD